MLRVIVAIPLRVQVQLCGTNIAVDEILRALWNDLKLTHDGS